MGNRIGLLTWHDHDNIGSNLQAYALQRSISNLGFNSEFINYSTMGRDNSITKRIIQNIIGRLDCMFPSIMPNSLKYRFATFIFQKNRLTVSKTKYTEDSLSKSNNEYDVFICGSDQIWAPNVFNPIFMLSFVQDSKIKASYAASIGLNCIPEELKGMYSTYLSGFSNISVRENWGGGINTKYYTQRSFG